MISIAMEHSAPNVARVPSFRAPYSHRSREYRTPSPPLRDIEPVSPSPHNPASGFAPLFVSRKRKTHEEPHNSLKRESDSTAWTVPASLQNGASSRFSPAPGGLDARQRHHQAKPSPSALDVFAAVATSPQLDTFSSRPGSAYADQAQWNQQSQRTVNPEYHRASKRTRSENFDSRSLLSGYNRPATSHVGQGAWAAQEARPVATSTHDAIAREHPLYNNRASRAGTTLEEDAELLLGFSQASRAHLSAQPKATVEQMQTATVSGPQQRERLRANAAHPPSTYTGHNLLRTHGAVLNGSHPSHYQHAASTSHSQISNAEDGQWYHQPVASTLPTMPEASSSKDEHLAGTMDGSEAPEKKSRVYRGWPKGKPRGPRKDAAEGRKTKKSTSKRSVNASKTGPKKTKENSTATSESAPTPPEASQSARRRSLSDMDALRGRAATDRASSNPRRAKSVPKDIGMVIKATPDPQHKSRQTVENICASCNETKNANNSLLDFWINCNGCDRWFHTSCAGFETERKVKEVDKYFCPDCEPQHGPTTYVRKSTRAHASIDYAGLHEGKIRTAVDLNEHHYIQPIKDGKLDLQPETFARMPPELVTVDFFEKSGGMTEPVLIPAHFNPQRYREEDESIPVIHNDGTSGNDLLDENLEYDYVQDVGQDKLDMVIPPNLTVRRVAELYGPEEKVEVIDVKLQEGEDRRWNMRQWADYYEAEGEKPVRNVISLEVSQSRLGRLIRRPKVVRDLDLQDAVWPQDESAKGVYPKVQFYCLMSVADCYTDFHIDFGGSSVYYHILKGRKTFFFIPPTAKNLKKYEEWCLSPDQNNIFLGDLTKECSQVDLYPGDTMLIPSGWIHAVWTPENSLVIGGNFLTRINYGMQIQINDIEKNTGVGRKFRYPYFQKIMWHALIQYLQQDPVPLTVFELLSKGEVWARDVPVWLTFDGNHLDEEACPELFNSRYYSRGEIEGLPDLVRYLHRTVLVSTGKASGVSKTTQEAVMRSMPKGFGDHTEMLKTFATWVAWKRGNERIPTWAYSHAELSEAESAPTDKKKSASTTKRLEREAARAAFTAGGPKRDLRKPSKTETNAAESNGLQSSEPGVSPKGLESGQIKHEDQSRPSSPVATNTVPKFGVRSAAASFPTHHSQAQTQAVTATADNVPSAESSVAPEKPSSTSASITADESIVDGSVASKGPQILPAKPSLTETKAEATTPVSLKQPRRQACMSCRLSKRRCVHDENGRIDPVKAQEPSIPRGPRGTKRAKEGFEIETPASKKYRVDEETPNGEYEHPAKAQEGDAFANGAFGVAAPPAATHQGLGQHARALGLLPNSLLQSNVDPQLAALENGQMAAETTLGNSKSAQGHGISTHPSIGVIANNHVSDSGKSATSSYKSSPMTELEPTPPTGEVEIPIDPALASVDSGCHGHEAIFQQKPDKAEVGKESFSHLATQKLSHPMSVPIDPSLEN